MVIVPTYNSEAFIEETLDSLKVQRVKWPVVVIDNASEDRTVEVVKTFPDVRLIQHEKNIGRVENLEFLP